MSLEYGGKFVVVKKMISENMLEIFFRTIEINILFFKIG